MATMATDGGSLSECEMKLNGLENERESQWVGGVDPWGRRVDVGGLRAVRSAVEFSVASGLQVLGGTHTPPARARQTNVSHKGGV